MLDVSLSVAFMNKSNGLCLSTFWRNENEGVIGVSIGLPLLMKADFFVGFKTPSIFNPDEDDFYQVGFEITLPFKSNLHNANSIGIGSKLALFTWNDVIEGKSEVKYSERHSYYANTGDGINKEKFMLTVRPYEIQYSRFYMKNHIGYCYELKSLQNQNKDASWIDDKYLSKKDIPELVKKLFGG